MYNQAIVSRTELHWQMTGFPMCWRSCVDETRERRSRQANHIDYDVLPCCRLQLKTI